MNVDDEIGGEATYFVFLSDGNELPSWFTKWKDGCIRIPLKQRYDKWKYRFSGEHVGSDRNYHFFLSEIHMTEEVTKDGIFLINIILTATDKQKKNKRGKNNAPRVTKQVEPLSYEILCPIIQFV